MKKLLFFILVYSWQLFGMEQNYSSPSNALNSAAATTPETSVRSADTKNDTSIWGYYRTIPIESQEKTISPARQELLAKINDNTNSNNAEENLILKQQKQALERLKHCKQETFKKSRRQLLNHDDVDDQYFNPKTRFNSLDEERDFFNQRALTQYNDILTTEKELLEQVKALSQAESTEKSTAPINNNLNNNNNSSKTNFETITALAVGKRTIFAGSKRPCVRIFDITSGKEEIPLFDHALDQNNVAQKIIIGDHEKLLIVGYTNHITFHNREKSDKIVKIFSSNQKIKNFIFTDNQLVALSHHDGIVYYGTFDAREKQNQFISPLLVCVDNPTFLNYLPKLQEVPTYEIHNKVIILNDLKKLVIQEKNSNNNAVQDFLPELTQHNGKITALDVNTTTNTVAIGTEDGIIKWTHEF